MFTANDITVTLDTSRATKGKFNITLTRINAAIESFLNIWKKTKIIQKEKNCLKKKNATVF